MGGRLREPIHKKRSDGDGALLFWAKALTVLWLFLLATYGIFSWTQLSQLKPNEVGDFLAGGFAPLAFAWLVVAVFLQREELQAQRKELEQNREALLLQADELRATVFELGRQTKIMDRSLVVESAAHKSAELERKVRNLATTIVMLSPIVVVLKPISTKMQDGAPFHFTHKAHLLGLSDHYRTLKEQNKIDEILLMAAANASLLRSEISLNADLYFRDDPGLAALRDLREAVSSVVEFCSTDGMEAAVGRIEGLNMPELRSSLTDLEAIITPLGTSQKKRPNSTSRLQKHLE
ncbi:MAG: hypothetical protein HOP09_17915 [Hyphomicrobium sp.]|nr:hypothetical protein [Hyphomicrobium sp.]